MTKEEREAILAQCEDFLKSEIIVSECHDCDGTRVFDNIIPALLGALETETKRADELEININNYKAMLDRCERDIGQQVITSIINIQTDRDRWKARAEALERATRTVKSCETCINSINNGECSLNFSVACDCILETREYWQFDETRFTEGEKNNEQ